MFNLATQTFVHSSARPLYPTSATTCAPHAPLFSCPNSYIQWELDRVIRRAVALSNARQNHDFTALNDIISSQSALRLQAIQRRQSLCKQGQLIPFALISQRLDLSPLEEDTLWILIAPHLSPEAHVALLPPQTPSLTISGLCALLSPSPSPYISPCAISDLLQHLASLGLLDPITPYASTSAHLLSPVSAPHYLAAACTGSLRIDDRIAIYCALDLPTVDLSEVLLPPSTQLELDLLLRAFINPRAAQHALHAPNDLSPRAPWLIALTGPPGVGKSTLASALCRAQRRLCLSARCDLIARSLKPKEIMEVALQNARFAGAALHLIEPEALLSAHPSLAPIILSASSLLLAETSDPLTLTSLLHTDLHCTLHLAHPDVPTRALLWESLLPHDIEPNGDLNLPSLASSFNLTGRQIQRAIDCALSRAHTQQRPLHLSHDDLCLGASLQIRTLSSHPNTLPTSSHTLTFQDLVLPDDTRQELSALLSALQSRSTLLNDWGFHQKLATGRGITALFHGDPGTGKSLSAEILAKEAQMPIIIVSMPSIMSKWVGETEKHLHDLFAQAQSQNAILFFDEADSLFSKRVSVERAQDSYQNMTINHLLQEVERFDGALLLSTNLEANMDPAFARRILFKVCFSSPDAPQREAIWRSLIPPQAPRLDLDLPKLARAYDLTGGYIKNAILRAAYHCASQHSPLTQAALEAAAYEQSRASGKLSRAPL